MAAHRWTTTALLALNGTLIAGVYACAKIAGVHGVAPFGVVAWQVAFAAMVVAAVVAVRGEVPRVTYSNVRYAGIAGVLGITGPNLVTFTALSHVPSGVIGVITALSPVLTYTIALVLRLERPDALRAAGMLTGLTGVLLILMPRGALPTSDALPWALFAMTAPLLLAGGNVFRSVAWPPGLQPMSAAALLLALQALLLVPAALFSGQWAMPTLQGGAGSIALWSAGGMTAAFYLCAFELQRRGGPIVVGQLGYVITVASLAIGMALFDERPTPGTFIAVGVVLLGVALVNRRPSERKSTIANAPKPGGTGRSSPAAIEWHRPQPVPGMAATRHAARRPSLRPPH